MTEQPPSASKDYTEKARTLLWAWGLTDADYIRCYPEVLHFAEWAVKQVAAALSAETERCAMIADNYGREGDRLGKEFACETADEIAARIRAPECDTDQDESLDGYCGADPNAARRIFERRQAAAPAAPEGPPPVRRLTQGEVNVMDRALRRSTRLIHEGELAPASRDQDFSQIPFAELNAKAALLARLREPDIAEAAVDALKYGDGPALTQDPIAAMQRVIARIEEMLAP